MLVNNFNIVQKIIHNNLSEQDGDTFYLFQCIARKKDNTPQYKYLGTNDSSYLVRTWQIKSFDNLLKHVQEMKYLCDTLGARLYMCTDKKSLTKTVTGINSDLVEAVTNKLQHENNKFSFKKMKKLFTANSAKEESSISNSKMWLIDIDVDNEELADSIMSVLKGINDAWSELKPLNYYKLKTVNGYHIMAERGFNVESDIFKPFVDNEDIDFKKNAMTLVYSNLEEVSE